MVIKGNIRGNGGQLAHYLCHQGENDHIRILDVDGRDDGGVDDLVHTLEGMSLMEQLTKSKQGLYHAQINPAYEEDRAMTDEDWRMASDILGQELGFENQRRAIVLHEKKGRIHAHVVWERYDNDRGIMIPIDHNYKRHDAARERIEKVLSQEQTPKRNKHRPELKELMTELWGKTHTREEFIKAVEQSGYMLAAGTKRPFMVVDKDGCSCDLVRQIKGVKKKEVAARLGKAELIPEKQAIALMRDRKTTEAQLQKQENQKIRQKDAQKENTHQGEEKRQRSKEDDARMKDKAWRFAENRDAIFESEKEQDQAERHDKSEPDITTDQRAQAFTENEAMTERQKDVQPQPEMSEAQKAAQHFADNRDNILSEDQQREIRRQELIAEMKTQLENSWQRGKDQSRSY